MLLATINSGTLIIALPDLERALGTSLLAARLGDPRLHDRLDRARAHARAGCPTCSAASRPTSAASWSFALASLGAGFAADGTELILWRILQGIGARVPVRQRRRARHRRLPARAARPGDGHEHDGRRRRPRARPGARRRARRDLAGTGSSGSTSRSALAGALWGALVLRELAQARHACAASTCSARRTSSPASPGSCSASRSGGLSGLERPGRDRRARSPASCCCRCSC